VAEVKRIFARLLDGGSWTDSKSSKHDLGIKDILVIAPYNAQVAALIEALPQGARVGTVDKFQGQEAPVVIYSMATSTSAEAPRGMPFLYSPNRLNVATSRARCLAIVVACPELFRAACKTPAQMKLANAFCRLREVG
jgi:superfamily I DNA and/or RNA helicase